MIARRRKPRGDFEEMCLAAGQGVGVIHEIMPAAEIFERIMLGAESRLSSAAELISSSRLAAGA
jgi:NAD(P)H-dependent flavin oxidoreductase YrpB (nitropropane dioxygenase family)